MSWENFPVALRILPAPLRRDLTALYGFARLTDQLGDAYGGDRLAALDWLEGELDRALNGAGDVHRLVDAAAAMLSRHRIDPQPLRDLIEANRVDQTVTRYPTYADLKGYCRLSANPVGRVVLGIFEVADAQRTAWSDDVCTALQIVEHLGDLAEDAAAGRVYVPVEDLERFGVDPAELRTAPARPALRALVAFEADRARRLLERGAALPGSLHGWARVATTAFVAGGYAAIDGLAATDFDPLAGAPTPDPRRIATRALGLWTNSVDANSSIFRRLRVNKIGRRGR